MLGDTTPRSPSLVSAYVALGSNLGDSPQIISDAVERLQEFSEFPLRQSSLWATTPVDCPPGSARFLNAAVMLLPRPDETPESLLAKLHALEVEFGRATKKVFNEPRPLDLDLIAFGDQRRHSEALILPHPRAHLRKFVLAPLREIAPDLILPGQTQTITRLLLEL